MKIYIFDTEYLSWSKKQSDVLANLRPKKQFPELIQIFIKEIFTKKKIHKLIYVKPKHYKVYPYRISKLTGINKTFLSKNGLDFKEAYKVLTDFVPKNSLLISNGDDYKILDSNIKINRIKKKNKSVHLLNFYEIIKNEKIFSNFQKLNFVNTETIKKTLQLNIKSHNAVNDVYILHQCLKKIKFKKSTLLNYKNLFKIYKI
tara:strand:+ start:46 stop:651 length:606 start_codon:yes stop_codon:yes gene_type:complete